MFEIGTVGTILQLLKLPDGTVKVLVEGTHRAKIKKYLDNDKFFEAQAEKIGDSNDDSQEQRALSRAVVTQFEQYIKLNKKIPPEVLVSVNQIDDASKLADTIASHISVKIQEKQELLELSSVSKRLEKFSATWKVRLAFCRLRSEFETALRDKWRKPKGSTTSMSK